MDPIVHDKLAVAQRLGSTESILWNSEVQKWPPLVAILSQINPVHSLMFDAPSFQPCFVLKISIYASNVNTSFPD
jgi:hypothetical protein